MKNFKVILSFAAIAMISIVVILNSCSKQELTDDPVKGIQDVVMSEDDISIMNKIITFREKIKYIKENPEFKSGEVMTAEEAIWNLETMFNVSYGFPDEQYAVTKTDNTVIIIDIDDIGEVSLDDVVLKYEEIINLVTQFYNNSGFANKGFLLLDLESGEPENGQMEITLRAVTGEKSENWEPFGPDDDWLYGDDLGDCEYNNSGTDAAQKIGAAVNSRKPLVSPPPGYRFVYVIDNPIVLFGHEYQDGNGQYYIFYIEKESGNFTDLEKCLEPDEMNFHANGEEFVINNKVPETYQKPSNWVFMLCYVEGKFESNPYSGNIPCLHHKNNLTYAYRYLVPIGIIDPPNEL